MALSTSSPKIHRLPWLGQAALLIGLVFLAYAPSLWNGFSLDDGPVVRNDPRLASWQGFPLLFRAVPAKPQLPWARLTRKLTLFAEYRIFGGTAFGFHLGNLAYHALAALAFWGVGRTVLRDARVAWMAAALFAVHPVVSSSVDSIANRKEMLSLLFFCCSLQLWERKPGPLGWGVSLSAFLLALLSKETAAAGSLIVLYRALQSEKDRSSSAVLKAFVRSLPFLALGACWSIYLHAVFSQGPETGNYQALFNPQTAPGYPLGTALRSVPVAWWTHLKQSLLPLEPLLTYEPSRFAAPTPFSLAVGFAALTGTLLFFRLSPQRSPVRLGLVWYAAFLLPTLNVVPSAYFFAERYLYAPLAGMSWVVCSLVCGTKRPARTWSLFLALFAASWLGTRARHPVWESNVSYWREALRTCPESAEAKTGLGSALVERGAWGQGEALLRQGLSVRPLGSSTPSALYNLGLAAFEAGKRDRAACLWRRVLCLDRFHMPTRLAYARTLALENETDAAVSLLEESLAHLERGYGPPQAFGLGSREAAECHQQLGGLAVRRGRLQEARVHYERAVTLSPSFGTSWLALGWLYGSGGVPDAEKACLAYKRALEEDAPPGACYWGLAQASERLGDPAEAVRWYEKAASSADLSAFFKEICRRRIEKLSLNAP